MKKILLILSISIGLTVAHGQNLVQDSSFENSSGQLSLQGWYDWNFGNWLPLDTNFFFRAVQDVPTNGGNWSLEINSVLNNF